MANSIERLRAATRREPFLAAELALLAAFGVSLVGFGLPDPYGLGAIALWLALPFTLALLMLSRIGVGVVRAVRSGDIGVESDTTVVRGLWYALESVVAGGFLLVGGFVALLLVLLSGSPNQGEGTFAIGGLLFWFMALGALLTVAILRLLVTGVWRLRERLSELDRS